ncbi:MAG: hypothetical protein C5B50_09165 [Verrucomicrobia bacterium]|nr:MAG: hypothetical protein C5B50_09165 [Verrucomicrobiota bacterium]
MRSPFAHAALALASAVVILTSVKGMAGSAEQTKTEPAAARKLYLTKCAKCHKFYDPAKYTDSQWHTWMEKMNQKAKIKPEHREMLSRYIEETFRHPENHVAPGLSQR